MKQVKSNGVGIPAKVAIGGKSQKNDLGRNTSHLAWLNQCDLGINFMWDVGEGGFLTWVLRRMWWCQKGLKGT